MRGGAAAAAPDWTRRIPADPVERRDAFTPEEKEENHAAQQSGAARRKPGTDPERRRISVLEKRPLRRHAARRGATKKHSHLAAALLFRGQERPVRGGVRAPRRRHQQPPHGGAGAI